MNYTPGQLDAIARQRGFPDYATWAAWNAHRQAGFQQPAQAQGNFLQRLYGKVPFMPSNILQYVKQKIDGAGQ